MGKPQDLVQGTLGLLILKVVSREATRYAEAAAQQFETAIKASREEAARRLSRELERAVAAFAREGERVLAERVTELGRRTR